jgi:hypothetical protein
MKCKDCRGAIGFNEPVVFNVDGTISHACCYDGRLHRELRETPPNSQVRLEVKSD